MSLHHSTLTYEPLPKVEETKPGLKPYEFNVLILPRVVQRVRASGLEIPPGAATREDEAGDEGLLVAISPLAFNEQDFPDRAAVPQIGDHVVFARYAGKSYVGADNRVYKIMKDKEILGGREPAEVPVIDVSKFKLKA